MAKSVKVHIPESKEETSSNYDSMDEANATELREYEIPKAIVTQSTELSMVVRFPAETSYSTRATEKTSDRSSCEAIAAAAVAVTMFNFPIDQPREKPGEKKRYDGQDRRTGPDQFYVPRIDRLSDVNRRKREREEQRGEDRDLAMHLLSGVRPHLPSARAMHLFTISFHRSILTLVPSFSFSAPVLSSPARLAQSYFEHCE